MEKNSNFNLLFIFFTILFFTIAQAQDPCANYTTCAGCSAESVCGWCSGTGSCHNGTKEGPSDGTVCVGSFWEFSQCQPCAYQRNCRTCLARSSDCSWCDSVQKCFDTGEHPAGCDRTLACSCDVYDDCATCSDTSGCAWCSDDGTCRNNIDQCSRVAHTCPCSGITTCEQCQESQSGCVWCGNKNECAPIDTNTDCLVVHSCTEYCLGGLTCPSCANLPGCAWCETDKICTSQAIPDCSDHRFSHTCYQCDLFQSCGSCLDGVGCQWCSDSQSCLADHEPCLSAHTCNSFCAEFDGDCRRCAATGRSCGYCQKTKKCLDVLDKLSCDNDLDFYCSHKNCGFNGGSFAGGMFLVIGLILLGVGGFFGYRYWKHRQNPSYTELK